MPDALAVVKPLGVLPVGFLLLQYSILLTVESLYLFISFLYFDLYVLGDEALISSVSFMQTSMCLDPHLN